MSLIRDENWERRHDDEFDKHLKRIWFLGLVSVFVAFISLLLFILAILWVVKELS